MAFLLSAIVSAFLKTTSVALGIQAVSLCLIKVSRIFINKAWLIICCSRDLQRKQGTKSDREDLRVTNIKRILS